MDTGGETQSRGIDIRLFSAAAAEQSGRQQTVMSGAHQTATKPHHDKPQTHTHGKPAFIVRVPVKQDTQDSSGNRNPLSGLSHAGNTCNPRKTMRAPRHGSTRHPLGIARENDGPLRCLRFNHPFPSNIGAHRIKPALICHVGQMTDTARKRGYLACTGQSQCSTDIPVVAGSSQSGGSILLPQATADHVRLNEPPQPAYPGHAGRAGSSPHLTGRPIQPSVGAAPVGVPASARLSGPW